MSNSKIIINDRKAKTQNISVSPNKNKEFDITVSDFKDNNTCKVKISCDDANKIITNMKNYMTEVRSIANSVSKVIDEIEESLKKINRKEIVSEIMKNNFRENALKKTKEIQNEKLNQSIILKDPIKCNFFINNEWNETDGIITKINMKKSSFEVKVLNTENTLELNFNNLCFYDSDGKVSKSCSLKTGLHSLVEENK